MNPRRNVPPAPSAPSSSSIAYSNAEQVEWNVFSILCLCDYGGNVDDQVYQKVVGSHASPSTSDDKNNKSGSSSGISSARRAAVGAPQQQQQQSRVFLSLCPSCTYSIPKGSTKCPLCATVLSSSSSSTSSSNDGSSSSSSSSSSNNNNDNKRGDAVEMRPLLKGAVSSSSSAASSSSSSSSSSSAPKSPTKLASSARKDPSSSSSSWFSFGKFDFSFRGGGAEPPKKETSDSSSVTSSKSTDNSSSSSSSSSGSKANAKTSTAAANDESRPTETNFTKETIMLRLNLNEEEAQSILDNMHDFTDADREDTVRTLEVIRIKKQLFLDTLPKGCELVEVDGDGNCLFRAASQIVYGTDEHHLLVRAKTCAYIRKFPEKCGLPKGISEHQPQALLRNKSLAEYLNEMEQPREWGDDICIHALENLYQRHAVVYIRSPEEGVGAVQHPEFLSSLNSKGLPLLLLTNEHCREHFNALESVETKTTRIVLSPGTREDQELSVSV